VTLPRFVGVFPSLILAKGYRRRYWNTAYFNSLDYIHKAAQAEDLTLAEIASRWMAHHSILQQDYDDAVLIGGSNLHHVRQNLIDLEKGPLRMYI
jgi:aflatoxin B1 aldehyde reductase